MSAVPPTEERIQYARPDPQGRPTFNWTLTEHTISDIVKLVAGPFNVLPVVFVPGIMGSNLRNKRDKSPVWRLDATLGAPLGLARAFATKNAGARQQLLHPDRCEVDPGGAVPKKLAGTIHNRDTYMQRGWGTVGETSYHAFLLWLEEHLNVPRNPAMWPDYFQAEATMEAVPPPGAQPVLHKGIRMGMQGEPFHAQTQFEPVMSDDLLARSKFMCPVYAVGYNWLGSNREAGRALSERIGQIIAENNKGQYTCQQVVLVTHSMGGLVARSCAAQPGMQDKIAGIVHGVMPAVGAAVAYRRCKVGMGDESVVAGLVIGSTGEEVTAVFAQAPGALQLLPSQRYQPEWLRVTHPDGSVSTSWPPSSGNDPYEAIYLQRNVWWGLVNEAWLSPRAGAPITWDDFATNVSIAKQFHASIGGRYHPDTYVYYGADPKQKSFERVTWRVRRGLTPDSKSGPSESSVMRLRSGDLRTDGTSPYYVGGQTEVSTFGGEMPTVYETSYWELHCEMQDGAGDGTVPVSSGSAPLKEGGGAIKQQFALTGFAHEPSYKNELAQRATLYAITKIAGRAKSAT
jgi:pimeloyl-ACP methyl ester carboxylesterase